MIIGFFKEHLESLIFIFSCICLFVNTFLFITRDIDVTPFVQTVLSIIIILFAVLAIILYIRYNIDSTFIPFVIVIALSFLGHTLNLIGQVTKYKKLNDIGEYIMFLSPVVLLGCMLGMM